jgi:5-methyltetrahydropteroyltriglutamate--homocysteine methyltransferase
LRRAYAQLESGAIAESHFRAVEDDVATQVLAEQAEAGIDLVTDGLVRWYDPISHTARRLAGVTINGLLRYFDNNCYFRQPVVRDHIVKTSAVVCAEYRFAARHSTRPVKAVLTGPYTLARLSLVETSVYRDLEALTLAYADVLAAEVADLAKERAPQIQIDEPAILRAPEDVPLLARALRVMAAVRGASELTLATYFGDATPLFDGLQDLPVDVLALDLTASPQLVRRLTQTGARRRLALGVLDGRSTRLEDVEKIAPLVARILGATRDGPTYLTTSCGLEFVPRDHARRKLLRLDDIRRAVLGGIDVKTGRVA